MEQMYQSAGGGGAEIMKASCLSGSRANVVIMWKNTVDVIRHMFELQAKMDFKDTDLKHNGITVLNGAWLAVYVM